MQPHKCDYKQHTRAIKSVLSKGCSGLDLFLDKSTKERRFWHASLWALVKNIFIASENSSAPLIGFHNLGRKRDNVQETLGSVPPSNVTGQKLELRKIWIFPISASTFHSLCPDVWACVWRGVVVVRGC